MPKFRQRSTVIEAYRWLGDNELKYYPEFIDDALRTGLASITDGPNPVFKLVMLSGDMVEVPIGDYAIATDDGNLYQCEHKIFEAAYEMEPFS